MILKKNGYYYIKNSISWNKILKNNKIENKKQIFIRDIYSFKKISLFNYDNNKKKELDLKKFKCKNQKKYIAKNNNNKKIEKSFNIKSNRIKNEKQIIYSINNNNRKKYKNSFKSVTYKNNIKKRNDFFSKIFNFEN